MRVDRVLDALDLSACVVDRQGRLVLTNRGWDAYCLRNGGRPSACCAGADYLAACAAAHDPTATAVATGLRDVLAGRRQRFAIDYACPSDRREGWFQVVATPVAEGAVVVHHDVTDRVRAVRRVAALGELATMVAVGAGLEAVFSGAARHACLLLGAHSAAIVRRDEERAATVVAQWSHRGPTVAAGTRIELTEREAAGLAAAERGARRQRHPPGEDSLAARLGYRSSIAAPVVVDARVWGVLVAAWTEPELRPEGSGVADALAEIVAIAVVRASDRAALAQQAATDGLTGLANRRELRHRLDQEVARALRHGRPLSLVLVDVDRFKRVNDRAGHAEGDRVLVDVAGVLRAASRSGDVAARIGGDEFVVVLPEVDAAGAVAFAERVRGAVTALAPAAGVPISISAGVSDLEDAGEVTALLHRADRALYAAKALGRGCVRAWSDL